MTVDEVGAKHPRRSAWTALTAWSAVAVMLQATQVSARSLWPERNLGAKLFDGWNQFDGPEYISIALNGYQQRQLVWFPLYPLLLGVLDRLVDNAQTSGMIVTMAGGASAAMLFWRWSSPKLDPRAQGIGLAVFLVYPYGWFLYGAVYSDALFVALTLAAFVLVERDRLVWAGVVAGLATAGRPSGFAVVLGLTVVAWERAGVLAVRSDDGHWTRSLRIPTRLVIDRLRPALFAPLLGLSGLVSYMAYSWVAFDSPTRFISEQANYHDTGSATYLKRQYFEAWYTGGFDGRHLATTTFQALILVAVIVSVPAVGRRFGWGYAVFVLALAALPAYSVSTFMGVGRYMLPAFPCFALAGEWLAKRRGLCSAWLSASAGLLLLMTFGFARSWYLT